MNSATIHGSVVLTTLSIMSNFDDHFFRKIEQDMINSVLVKQKTNIDVLGYPLVTVIVMYAQLLTY